MKKWMAILAAVLALAFGTLALAEGTGRTLREGKYIIGEDIAAGDYVITCTGTEGEQLEDAYGAMGKAYDALDDTDGFGELFGALGSMMSGLSDMTVEIIGDYGTVLKSFEMKTGDTAVITLQTGTALQISSGSCTIEER